MNSVQQRDLVRRAVWSAIYLLFILAPLFALLLGALQFGLTARFRYVTQPWGEDVIYHFHRRISLLAVGLVVVHP